MKPASIGLLFTEFKLIFNCEVKTFSSAVVKTFNLKSIVILAFYLKLFLKSQNFHVYYKKLCNKNYYIYFFF